LAVNFNDYPVENITVPNLVINEKDDPMVKHEDTEYFLKRVNAET
jgi:predicted alpha/beta-fold hydrolase